MPYSSKNGLTLIELTVVLLISIIMLSVGVAAFLPIEKMRVQNAAKDLQNDIRYAQRMSLADKTEYMIVIDAETKSFYSIVKRELGGDKLVKQAYFPKGTILYSTNAAYGIIRFTRKGTINQALKIILMGDKYNIALTCALGTGNVKVWDVRPVKNMYRLEELN